MSGLPALMPLPPHDPEAEEYVLGAMMISGHAAEAVRYTLTSDDFYRTSHGHIYLATLAVHDSGASPPDVVLVAAELERRGELDEVGGRERLREIATLVPAATNASHFAKRVAEKARDRREYEAAYLFQEKLRAGADASVERQQLAALLSDDCQPPGPGSC
jgi:replicative DNA helicase